MEALLNSAVSSPMLATVARRCCRRAAGSGVVQLLDDAEEDLLLALKLGREVQVTLPTTAFANELHDGRAQHGRQRRGLLGRLPCPRGLSERGGRTRLAVSLGNVANGWGFAEA